LEHLLTMRSGINFSNDHFSMEMWVGKPADPIRYILNKPLFAEPGNQYRYRDADPQLLGYAMQTLLGQTEEAFAQAYLWDPLGIHDYYWDHGKQGETMAAHGLHLRPRDLAKIGQLMLDEGKWKEKNIISATWHEISTTQKLIPPERQNLGYGYYWWIVPEAKGYSSWGHGGQFVFIIPPRGLVLVLISLPDTSPDYVHGTTLPDFVELTKPLWQSTM
jgi:CubicO group peptidase (beta-lactamase class C family)